MKIFLTALFFYSIGCLLGQNTNPFDIPERRTNPISTSTTSPVEFIADDSVEVNKFELGDTSHQDSVLLEEAGNIGFLEDASNKDITESNPFDIVPPSVPKETSVSLDRSPKILTKAAPKDTKIIALVYSVVMLIILTLAISMDRKKFGFMVQSCINSNNLRTLYRDNKAWTNGQSIILYIFFFLNLAFVIWFLNIKIDLFPNFDLFLILGLLIACYVIRHLVMWSIATIFPLGQEVGLHNFSISLHNMVLGVFLLPFILGLEFMPSVGYQTMLYSVVAIILLLYVLRQTKGLFLSFGMRGFNLFYFFVYLCAVEIAPILVVYKMISGAL